MKSRLEINPFPIWRNKARIAALGFGKLGLIASVSVHSPDLIRAAAIGSKKNVATIRRSLRIEISEGVVSQLSLFSARAINRPDVAVVAGIDKLTFGALN